HVVRGGDVLELLRAVRSGDIRVVLAGELAVRALDLIRAGVAGDAQDGVVIAHRLLSVGSQVAGICGWAGVPWSAAHESGQVAGDRADGRHRGGVVHPGGAEHAELADGLRTLSTVTARDHRGLGEVLVMGLPADT